jgi:hypothetical protein
MRPHLTTQRRQLAARRDELFRNAAHIHSPAGGQGMNTGIGDAIGRMHAPGRRGRSSSPTFPGFPVVVGRRMAGAIRCK